MIDWADASLVETATAIATGKIRSRDVTEACLDRHARFNPTLNCFVALDPEAARGAADAADAQVRRGDPLGPLHGTPLAHKDMYYRNGRVSACGSRVRETAVASKTATALTKLDGAGAIEIGRLVMVEFAMGPHGYNANYPLCRNAWNPDYIPCGSSSGSGVAVASGMAFGSLGSDTGGSIRCPASASGLVGLAPTNGRVSRFGVMPMSPSLDVVGPLARRARDCARLLRIIAGPDDKDSTTLAAAVPDYEAELSAPRRLPRIGIARGYFDQHLHPEVEDLLNEAALTFSRLGFPVIDAPMPVASLSEMADLHPLLMKAEGAANHLASMRAHPDLYTTEVRERLQAGFFVSAVDYIQAQKLRGTFLRQFSQHVFSDVDLLLTPVLRNPLPTISETTGKKGVDYLDMVVELTRNTKVVNYLGLPAISVPCGFTRNGLPAAFQMIGRGLSESTLLFAAERYEEAAGWHRMRPPLLDSAAAA
jgi:aspartyl-tRNA(Asn)/glutamyl-tRNA(Gln) amidotransferase subunit A